MPDAPPPPPPPSSPATRQRSAPDETPLGDRARDAALRRLTAHAKRFPELSLAPFQPEGESKMTPRDAAFAVALVDSSVRRWLTLRFLISRSLRQPFEQLEARVQGALLGGAAQLTLLDKAPAHAALNHSVEWTKRRVRPGAAKLVNAVLRRVSEVVTDERRDRWTDQRDELPLENGSALVLADAVLPEDELERLAIATSHPIELLSAWRERMPMREVRALAHHSLARPPVILNTQHAETGLPGGAPVTPHDAPGHHVFTGAHDELLTLLGERRDIWVQDPASSLAVGSVLDLRPRLVLDLCAGQGTKTRQLASAFPDAGIIASDIDQARLHRLAEVFKDHPRVSAVGPRKLADRLDVSADLILLDVPCSNTGVLARRPEARYRYGPQSVESAIEAQRQIFADALRLRAPRGKILYSTCSLEPSENDETAAWAAKWHQMKATRQAQRMPSGTPGGPATGYSDGSFAVVLG